MPNIVQMFENITGGKAVYFDGGSLKDKDGNKVTLQTSDNLLQKNRIINSSMNISQRGNLFYIKNQERFTSDRWVTSSKDDNELEVRVSDVYSENEGSYVDELDILGDGSCIAGYKLDDSADDIGDNHNGVWDGNEQYNDGRWNKSAYFDESSVIKVDSLDKPDFPFTISLWVKNDDCSDGAVIYDFKGAKLAHYTGDTGLKIWDKNKVSADSGQHISNNAFYHIVVIHYGDENTELYVNLVKIDLSYKSDANNYEYNHLLIGARGDGDNVKDGYFKGYIDQFRVFNKALSYDEIKKIFVEDKELIFKKHLKVLLRTKSDNYSVVPFEYRFEGYTISDLLINKEKATLSFDFSSTKNQDYYVRLYYPNGDLYKEEKFTYDNDNKFKRFSITFDFDDVDLDKVDLYYNLSLVLTICENDEIDENDYLRLTNVQFEKGEEPTQYYAQPIGLEYLSCMRYFQSESNNFIKIIGRTTNYINSDNGYSCELPGRSS